MTEDVPSPIDLRSMPDARAWADTALDKRPWRTEFFEAFAAAIEKNVHRVLELGSGPGFLVRHLLIARPDLDYVALDFSPAMHELARQCLLDLAARVTFVERDFREPQWGEGLGRFPCVVTHQAVHELRHKRRAVGLHRQVKQLLEPDGIYLVCDHYAGDGGMTNEHLYMQIDEQRQALTDAGFGEVTEVLRKGGLVLHRAS